MSELDYPEGPVGPFEREHDQIMHDGYMARQHDNPASNNPYSEANCAQNQVPYELEKDESWSQGWIMADMGKPFIIDGERL